MCYSAEVWADYRKYVRYHGADIDIATFYDLYWRKARGGQKLKTPKALDDAFVAGASTEQELAIKALIEEMRAAEEPVLQQTMFAQKTRLADAERKLAVKFTKTAAESARIAKDKIDEAKQRLEDLHRTEPKQRDNRIFPGHYAPVMVMEAGRLVVKPMRYLCRPAGLPPAADRQYSGAYNARLDNLEGQFWRRLFGFSHGVIAVSRFYENVKRHKMERRELQPGEEEENVVLRFEPQPQHDMWTACLWSHWEGGGETLLSFAAITDDPPPEVAAAGHDRCIISIKPEHVQAWLNPEGLKPADLYAILRDKQPAFYEHRIAA